PLADLESQHTLPAASSTRQSSTSRGTRPGVEMAGRRLGSLHAPFNSSHFSDILSALAPVDHHELAKLTGTLLHSRQPETLDETAAHRWIRQSPRSEPRFQSRAIL